MGALQDAELSLYFFRNMGSDPTAISQTPQGRKWNLIGSSLKAKGKLLLPRISFSREAVLSPRASS